MYQHKMIRNQTPAELKIIEILDSLGDELGKINDQKILEIFYNNNSYFVLEPTLTSYIKNV